MRIGHALAASLSLFAAATALAGEPAAPTPPTAAPRTIEVHVIEIAGGRAFLEPGEQAGLVPGTDVVIKGKHFRVLGATATHAQIDPGDATLHEGDRGEATVTPGASAAAVDKLPPPAPLSRFAGQWRDATMPAAEQHPKSVSLGGAKIGASGHRPVRLSLVGHALSFLPDTGPTQGHLELDTRLSVEPWRERPFALDADAAAYLWLGDNLGPVGNVEQAVRVRELRLRYGGERDPFAAAGRLRWASRTVGMLDGVRLRSPHFGNGLTVAAFGGIVPDVVTGAPSTAASRFGVELSWDAPKQEGAPRVDASLWGSTFGGSLDERRLAVSADLAPGPLLIDGRVELSMFDADNPWHASQLELTGAGVDVGWHADAWHAAARLDVRTPERSRWLASLLPQAWQCTATPEPPGTAEPCDGSSHRRLGAGADLGWTSRRASLSIGASEYLGDSADEIGGFADARARGLLGFARVGASATVTRGGFVDLYALRLEAGGTFRHGTIDLAAYWRGGILDYAASVSQLYEHRVGLDAAIVATPELDLVWTVEGTTGADNTGLAVLATVAWRPLP